MKRDMDLIRKILLAVEAGESSDATNGFSEDSTKYHQALAIEAGLLKGKALKYLDNGTEIPSAVAITGLTWEGHEFIDLIKRSDVWSTIQDNFKEESFSTIVQVAKDLATGWAKKKVADLLGQNS